MLVFSDMILYYIIIGDTFSQLFHQYFMHDTEGKTIMEKKNDLKTESLHAQVLGEKAFHILLIGGILVSVIFMRKLRDFKVVSYLFIIASLLLVTLMGFELWIKGSQVLLTFENLRDIKIDYHLVTAFNIIFQAFCAQFIVFPTYLEMKNRSNQKFARASGLAFSLDALFFVLIGIEGFLIFGEDVEENVLDDMAKVKGIVSIVARATFSVVLMLDIPFLFFAARE